VLRARLICSVLGLVLGTGTFPVLNSFRGVSLPTHFVENPPPLRLASADVVLPREFETIASIVPPGATFQSLLRANQLKEQLIARVIESARTVFDLRQLRANQPYRLVRTLDGLLREFEYQIDADRFLRIVSRDRSQPTALDVAVLAYDTQKQTVAFEARIDADTPSLVAAIDARGENVQLAMALAEVFAGEVDFQSELQAGDTFRLLFEKRFREGQFAGYGPILAAAIDVNHRTHHAVLWRGNSSGKRAYYDENGRSLRRFLLRSPLKFEPRITSRFARHRMHPIDHVMRAHLGVDYAAPEGAAVVAVASGTVVSSGYSGAGGNLVHLRHPGGVETYYLHLSAFARGIRTGAHVNQGQLIGRVGSTGAATGPHLDYRLKKGGVFVNPLVVHADQAPGEPLLDTEFATFRTMRDRLLSELNAALPEVAAAAQTEATGSK
jgi:murein DD-endopeptidase MepM/ murein hydrolase activator NlpD